MNNNGPFWAAWSENAVFVYHKMIDGTVEQTRLEHNITSDSRYFLKLAIVNSSQVYLLSSHHGKSVVEVSQDMHKWASVDINEPPGCVSLPPFQHTVLNDGTIAGLDTENEKLILWRANCPARLCDLPEGLRTRDISRDKKGQLWIVGNTPSEKLYTEDYQSALAVSDNEGASWRVEPVPMKGLFLAWRVLLSGARGNCRTINAINDYLVITSESSDIENPSTYVFLRDPQGRWRGRMLRNDILRAVVPLQENKIALVTHYGKLITYSGGNKWRSLNLDTYLRAALTQVGAPKDVRYEILDAQASGDTMIMVISLRNVVDQRMARFGEAVVTLQGEKIELVSFQGMESPEVISACLVS